MFTPYRPERIHCQYFDKIHDFEDSDFTMSKLCRKCGYPYGLHYGNKCPTRKDIADREILPEFHLSIDKSLLKVL